MGPTTAQSLKALSQSFFCCPGKEMAPDLIGCPLVKRQPSGELLRAVIEEMEAYYQSELACHGHGRSSLSNDTLSSESGWFYVHGSQHCGSERGAAGRGERGDPSRRQDRVLWLRSLSGELGIALLI
jgi:hypothetical protein